MFVTGHLAASVLAARRWDLDLRMVVAGGLFPDVVDKSCRYILGIVPVGRLPAHTLLGLVLTTAAVYVWGRQRGRARPWTAAWLVGYGLHLACDALTQVPLLWPFRAYRFQPRPYFLVFQGPLQPADIATLVAEALLIVAAVWVEVRRWRAHRQPPATAVTP